MPQQSTYALGKETEADRIAKAERLREFGVKPVPVVPEPTEEDVVASDADRARLAELEVEHEKGIRTSYRGLKMFASQLWKDQERCLEAGRIAARLGVSNPITVTVMKIGEGTGVPQDDRHLFDLAMDKAKRLYRGYGVIDKDKWESL